MVYRSKVKVYVLSVDSQTDKLTGLKNIGNGQIKNNILLIFCRILRSNLKENHWQAVGRIYS